MNISNILYTVILYPLVQLIEIAFKLFNKLFDNTGIAIIGVSITVTLLCLPLYVVAEHWQQVQRDTEKKLKPYTDRIKSVFKGDEQYMILSTYYRQNHYHPIMALRSSFGLLIQIPFFMAAYSCLSKMPDLQGQSFLFIRDMGKQDALFMIGSFPVNILPIAMTIINIIAGAIYTKGFPVKEKVQIYGMAVIFLALLYTSPSGLVLYWTMNNVFSLVKNIFYKMKNPIKVFYYCMCTCIVIVGVYILFIYSGGASFKKRLASVLPLVCCMLVPLIIKAINYLLEKPLSSLVENIKLRTGLFIFSSIALCILSGLVIPSTIISSSVQEFSNVGAITNPSQFLMYSFWQSFGLFIIWPLCIYFLFHEKVQSVMSVLFSGMLFCAVINTYLFQGNYGSLDITLKFIGGINKVNNSFIIINACSVLVVIGLLILLLKFKLSKYISSVALIMSVGFICLGIINITKINKEYKEFQKITINNIEDNTFTKQFHLSKTGQNIVLLMLDRSESSFFEDILEDFPEIKDTYQGFTFYRNTLSCNGHTFMGAPGVYGGYEYIPSEMNKQTEKTIKTKINEALLLLPRVLTEQSNFKAYLSDLSWGNMSYVSDMSFTKGMNNIEGKNLLGRYTGDFKKEYMKNENENALSDSVIRNLLWISFFRESPAMLRPVLYYKGSWWASEAVTNLDDFIDWYGELNYLPQITDCNSNDNNLIIFANETTHCNENIKDLNLIPEERLVHSKSSAYDINVVCLLAIGRWLDYLKENDVYDNTRIIIVADHGIGYGNTINKDYDNPMVEGKYAKDHINPLMLVKDFNKNGPLVKNMSFMTNADTPTIILDGIVDNPVNPFTNKEINNEYKKTGVPITIDDIFMPHHSKSSNIFTVKENSWYTVNTNIFESKNWVKGNLKK